MQRVLEALSEARVVATLRLARVTVKAPRRVFVGSARSHPDGMLKHCRARMRCWSLRRGRGRHFAFCARLWRGKPALSQEEVRQQRWSSHVSTAVRATHANAHRAPPCAPAVYGFQGASWRGLSCSGTWRCHLLLPRALTPCCRRRRPAWLRVQADNIRLAHAQPSAHSHACTEPRVWT